MINYLEKNFSDYPTETISLPKDKSWYIYDSIKKIKITKKQLQMIVIDVNKNLDTIRYLVLPFHRFSKNYYTILLENDSYTYEKLLNVIYDFYNKKTLTYFD
jgi:hypothetical protein